MARSVDDQFVETLAAAGVKRIYGIVGDSLNGLTDAVRRQGKMEWLHFRHEEVAAFAAGAEAHLTGEIAVCAGSCGPGICTSSTVCLIVIARGCPSSELPRISPHPRSAVAIFRRRSRRFCFRNAATIAS